MVRLRWEILIYTVVFLVLASAEGKLVSCRWGRQCAIDTDSIDDLQLRDEDIKIDKVVTDVSATTPSNTVTSPNGRNDWFG